MKIYYVNKNAQANGDYAVHNTNCSWLPKRGNRIYPSEHSNCKNAV